MSQLNDPFYKHYQINVRYSKNEHIVYTKLCYENLQPDTK